MLSDDEKKMLLFVMMIVKKGNKRDAIAAVSRLSIIICLKNYIIRITELCNMKFISEIMKHQKIITLIKINYTYLAKYLL